MLFQLILFHLVPIVFLSASLYYLLFYHFCVPLRAAFTYLPHLSHHHQASHTSQHILTFFTFLTHLPVCVSVLAVAVPEEAQRVKRKGSSPRGSKGRSPSYYIL